MRIARAGRYIWLSLAAGALGVLGAAPAAPGQAPAPVAVGTVSASKVAIIRRILESTKAIDRVLSGIEAAIPAQRASNPQIPRAFWDELLARARSDTVRLVDLLARAYDSQFSVAELEQLAAFYDSPVGRHLVQAQPTILAQTAQAGQLWGARLSADIMQDLQRRGSQLQQP